MAQKLSIRVMGMLVATIITSYAADSVRAQQPPQHRAGHPECIACYARRSDYGPYSGSYVGGSCAFKGWPRGAHEGTWGWDYCGPLHSERPWMQWCHGRRCQGGTGAYKTDGPHVPDLLAKLRF
jgi:hypothetical protein